MNWLLLSHRLSEATPAYGGKETFQRSFMRSMERGDTSNSEQWILGNHVGTHIDLPRHFDISGKTMSDYADEEWIFSAPFILDLKAGPGEIIQKDSAWDKIPKDCDCLLLRTGFEQYRAEEVYWNNNPGVGIEVGIWLRSHRPSVKIMGMDTISLSAYQNREIGRAAHRVFLGSDQPGAPIRLIEDMKLMGLPPLREVLVSPLFVKDADAAPVTVWGRV